MKMILSFVFIILATTVINAQETASSSREIYEHLKREKYEHMMTEATHFCITGVALITAGVVSYVASRPYARSVEDLEELEEQDGVISERALNDAKKNRDELRIVGFVFIGIGAVCEAMAIDESTRALRSLEVKPQASLDYQGIELAMHF